jgi:hypothetical protein
MTAEIPTRYVDWQASSLRLVLIVLVFGGLLGRLAVAIHFGLNAPPEPGSDAAEYDSYAWNMAQGRGFPMAGCWIIQRPIGLLERRRFGQGFLEYSATVTAPCE